VNDLRFNACVKDLGFDAFVKDLRFDWRVKNFGFDAFVKGLLVRLYEGYKFWCICEGFKGLMRL
jgi:hypothetical protein